MLCGLTPSMVFAQSKDHSANGLELKGAFTPARAMKLIYGSYDNSQEVSKWIPKPAKSYPRGWPTKDVEAGVVLNAPFVDSTQSRHLLVTWARPTGGFQGEFTCHSCGVLIGLALFTRTPNGWQVTASDLQFGEYGEFGGPPTISLQPLGPNRYGLLISAQFGSAGVATNSVTIVVPRGRKFLKAFSKETVGSWYEDGCSGKAKAIMINYCFAYDGDIDFVPGSQSDYYDLLLTKRIYRSISKKHPIGVTVTRFKFNGWKYVPVSSNK